MSPMHTPAHGAKTKHYKKRELLMLVSHADGSMCGQSCIENFAYIQVMWVGEWVGGWVSE